MSKINLSSIITVKKPLNVLPNGTLELTSDVKAANDQYTFLGAKPSEIAQLSGTKRKIQTQLDELDANKQPKGNYALASEFKSFTIHGQHDQSTAVVQHHLSANTAQQQTTQRGLRPGFGHHHTANGTERQTTRGMLRCRLRTSHIAKTP
jgi:hypothetical protein